MGFNPVCVDRQISTFSSEIDGRVFLCLLEDVKCSLCGYHAYE